MTFTVLEWRIIATRLIGVKLIDINNVLCGKQTAKYSKNGELVK